MPFHDKTAYVWMGMLPLKKRVNHDKCSFATKQRIFGVFAINEILRYRGTRFPHFMPPWHTQQKPPKTINQNLRRRTRYDYSILPAATMEQSAKAAGTLLVNIY